MNLLHIVGMFQHIDIESARDVPRDMAVEWPYTRVVHVKLEDDVGWCVAVILSVREQVHVPALWIVSIDNAAIPGTVAFCQNEHVVAVHVHTVILLASADMTKEEGFCLETYG